MRLTITFNIVNVLLCCLLILVSRKIQELHSQTPPHTHGYNIIIRRHISSLWDQCGVSLLKYNGIGVYRSHDVHSLQQLFDSDTEASQALLEQPMRLLEGRVHLSCSNLIPYI